MRTTKRGRRTSVLSGVALVVVLGVVGWLNWDELQAWYFFWRDFKSIGKNAQGYPEYRHRRTGILMVWVPGGTYLLGSPEEEKNRRGNEQQHRVTLSAFLIAKYEVNQRARNTGDRGLWLPDPPE